MDSMRPRKSERRVTGGKRTGKHRTSTTNQRSCFKCKRLDHIARNCKYSSPSARKAGAGVIATAPREGERKNSAAPTSHVPEVSENL
ncbi:hypothetical protein PoB_000544000 [Plakobranchus ocellatus]|uniref:CCHC-type domain-containing protein n=1 Tax=Plakobranchus ocellatus TaxID=259542 RepID=A0AAV3Y732_9GAST|nr:hypothetical protein PoB_000544000 [Plakobranchus ocellatus]